MELQRDEDSSGVAWTAEDVMPFEFFYFMDELMSGVLNRRKINAVVALCDEANQFSPSTQTELLSRYLEMFATKNVRFLLVLRTEAAQAIRPACSVFEELCIGNLNSQNDIKLLIEKRLAGTSIGVTADAVQVLWDKFQGMPLDSLRAAVLAYDAVRRAGSTIIDGATMTRSCSEHLHRLKRLEGIKAPPSPQPPETPDSHKGERHGLFEHETG